MVLDGLKFVCPQCEQEHLYRRESILGEEPLLCQNPACATDLTLLRPALRYYLREADGAPEDAQAEADVVREAILLWRRRLQERRGPVH